MAAEMQQVNRTDVSVQGDQVEIFRPRDQHHHARHVHVSEVNPQVGLPGAKGVAFVVGCDQVPPTGGFVLPADQVQRGRVIEAGRRKVVAVDRNTIQLGNRVPRLLVGVADEVAGHLKHGPVKGEIGVESGSLAQRLKALWNPV